MRILASVVLALAITAMPATGQAKITTAGAPAPAVVSGAQANTNESELVIPDSDGNSRTARGGAGPGQPAAAATPGVSTWDFVRMLVILAAVVGAIYLLFWILRRSAGRKITENNLIRVLGSRSLAGNKSLHLVEVGSSVFLVGASDGGVELISQITDKESLDAVKLKSAEESPPGRRNFQQLLSEVFRPAARAVSLHDGVGFLRGQRDKLRKL
ncbi:MAG TPA: flagellar biosynthetic protein FliO [Spirochaetia bacterium]|nr:flagellar biosynthetic protein FliO [Spirochaetia bacterium]